MNFFEDVVDGHLFPFAISARTMSRNLELFAKSILPINQRYFAANASSVCLAFDDWSLRIKLRFEE